MPGTQRLTAEDVWFEAGRRVQAVALVMRKHTVTPALGVCDCGQVPDRTLPMFGDRCETAGAIWDHAYHAVMVMLNQVATDRSGSGDLPPRVIGRASVERRT